MPSFTKEDLREEIKAIITAEAAALAALKSPEAAASFLDVKGSLYGFDCSSQAVEMGNFDASATMADAFDYAFNPRIDHDEAMVSDMKMDVQLIVSRAYHDGVIINPFLTVQTNYCEVVFNTILARAKLDFEDSPLFIEEVAYLADMSVGSVRNAAKGTHSTVLKTYNLGKRTVIEREEAIRWLSGRRGYVPSPIHKTDPVGSGDISAAQTAQALGKLLTRLRTHLSRTESDLAGELSWPVEKISAWENGTYEFGLEDAQSLARILGLDPIVFLPKALELALRRAA